MPRIEADSVAAHRVMMEARLLDALGDLLAERGYSAVTLADVAARAGLARSSVYSYVRDKEALLMAYVRRAVERFVAETRAEMAAAPDAPGRMRVLVRRQMHQFRAEPGAGGEVGMLEGSALGPGAHARLMEHFAPLHVLLADIVTEGRASGAFRDVDADAILPLILACLGAERIPVGSGREDPDHAAARVTDFVIHALGAG